MWRKYARMIDKHRPFVLAIAIILIVLIGTTTMFSSVYLPQSDITFQIAKIEGKTDSGLLVRAYPSSVTWSKTYRKGELKKVPDLSISATLNGVNDIGTQDITFNNTKYRVYMYDCLFSIEVKAIAQPPWHPSIFDKWYHDEGITLTVYLELVSRGDWRLFLAKLEEIEEVSRWTSPEEPDTSWSWIWGGTADAREPSAENALIAVLTGTSGNGVKYAYDADTFFSAFTLVDGKYLKFVAYLYPPSAQKWDALTFSDHLAYGEAYVTWKFAVRVAIAEEIPPENPDLGDLEDNEPTVEGLKRAPIPWWANYIIGGLILIVLIIALIQIPRIIIAKKKASTIIA